MEKTLSEIQKERDVLASKISRLVSEFHASTNVKIEEIKVTTIDADSFCGPDKSFIISIPIKA